MRSYRPRPAVTLGLATALGSALALVGLTAGPAQALPKECVPARFGTGHSYSVTCTGGTGYFKVWAVCEAPDWKEPVRVEGNWTRTNSTSTVNCPLGGLVSDGGWYVSESVIGPA